MSDSQKTSQYSEISLGTLDYETMLGAAEDIEGVDERGTTCGNKWFRTGFLVVWEDTEK